MSQAVWVECIEGCPPCEGCCDHPAPAAETERARWRRWAWSLTGLTVAWNLLEAGAALVSGSVARSVALVAFGLDSLVETSSALVIAWRLSRPGAWELQEQAERRAVRLIALSLWAIAGYVAIRAVADLAGFSERPEPSPIGLAVLVLAAAVMAILAVGKRHVARQLGSPALAADARQTLICLELSAVVLVGLAANWLFGWWWADPFAGLAVASLAAREGWEAWASGELEGVGSGWAHCLEGCCAECPVPA